ncbi:MAG: hypothetical protein ACREJP_08610 [Candidatus Methylomirabilales bacterium]
MAGFLVAALLGAVAVANFGPVAVGDVGCTVAVDVSLPVSAQVGASTVTSATGEVVSGSLNGGAQITVASDGTVTATCPTV